MAIYKGGQGFALGKTENKSNKWPEQYSNPGLLDLKSPITPIHYLYRYVPPKGVMILKLLI